MSATFTATVAPCGTVLFVNLFDANGNPSLLCDTSANSFNTPAFHPAAGRPVVTVNGAAVPLRFGQPGVADWIDSATYIPLFLYTPIAPTDAVAVTVPAGLVNMTDGTGGTVLSPGGTVTLTNGATRYARGQSQNLAGQPAQNMLPAFSFSPKTMKVGWNWADAFGISYSQWLNLGRNTYQQNAPYLTPSQVDALYNPNSTAASPVLLNFNEQGFPNPVDTFSGAPQSAPYLVKWRGGSASSVTMLGNLQVGTTQVSGPDFVATYVIDNYASRVLSLDLSDGPVTDLRIYGPNAPVDDAQLCHPQSLQQASNSACVRFMITTGTNGTGLNEYGDFVGLNGRSYDTPNENYKDDVYNVTSIAPVPNVIGFGNFVLLVVTLDRDVTFNDGSFFYLALEDGTPNPAPLWLNYSGTLKPGVTGVAASGSIALTNALDGAGLTEQVAGTGVTLAANQILWAGPSIAYLSQAFSAITITGGTIPSGTTARIVRAVGGYPAPDLMSPIVNQLPGCDHWVNIPYSLSDAACTTIFTNIANTLASDRKCVVEYGNESWNTASPYDAQAYWHSMRNPNGVGSPTPHYAIRATQVHDLAVAAFTAAGRPATDVVRLIGSQAGSTQPTLEACQQLHSLGKTFDALATAPYQGPGPEAWVKNPYGLSTTASARAVGAATLTVADATFGGSAAAPVPTPTYFVYLDVFRSGNYVGTFVSDSVSGNVFHLLGPWNPSHQGLPLYDSPGAPTDFAVLAGDTVVPNFYCVADNLSIGEVVDLRSRSCLDLFPGMAGQFAGHLSAIRSVFPGWAGQLFTYEGGVASFWLSNVGFIQGLYTQAMAHHPSSYYLNLYYLDSLQAAGVSLHSEMSMTGTFTGEAGYANAYAKYTAATMVKGVGDGSDGAPSNLANLQPYKDYNGNHWGFPMVMPYSGVSPFGEAQFVFSTLAGLPSGAKYRVNGPTVVTAGQASTPFSAHLLDGVTLGSGVTLHVTFAADVAGSWSGPTTVALTDANRDAVVGTFTPTSPVGFTATNPGTTAVTTTNDGGVPAPNALRLMALPPVPVPQSIVLTYTGGPVAAGSGTPAITVSLGPAGAVPQGSQQVVVTFGDNGVGGGFYQGNPQVASVTLTAASPVASVSYIPPRGVGGTYPLTATSPGLTGASFDLTVTLPAPVAGNSRGITQGAFLDTSPAPAGKANAATFVEMDTTTQGNWAGGSGAPVYGKQGYAIVSGPGDAAGAIAAGVNFSGFNGPVHFGLGSTTDPRNLYDPATPSSRSTATVGGGGNIGDSISLTFTATDGNAHRVAVYACSFGYTSFTQTVSVTDPSNGTVFDARVVQGSVLSGGVYLVYDFTGSINVNFINNGYPIASKLTLNGPAALTVGAPSSEYVVTTDGPSLTAVTVTPALPAGWTATPPTLTFGPTATIGTFRVVPTTQGNGTVTASTPSRLAGGAGLTSPTPLAVVSTSAASAVTLAGPSYLLLTGAGPGTFTAGLNGVPPAGSVEVTPSSSLDGAFTPSMVTLTPQNPTATFQFAPTYAGVAAVALTNNAGLLNPAPLAVLSLAALPVKRALPPKTRRPTRFDGLYSRNWR